jgi:predicted nucleotidyltransferase
MNPKELLSFNIKDAAEFHDDLNPALFSDSKLIPEVKQKLLAIAKDFITHLGLSNGLEVTDITLSGSNAAYSYTKFSDIDLHLVVDYSKLNNDEVYRELFTAKKNEYNEIYDIKIHDYDVELYVQDEDQPHFTLGEYSVLNDKWLSFPKKRRANYDERATYAKSMKLAQLSNAALKSSDQNVVERVIEKIRKYRKAGLEMHGEFGPENLSYKWLRNQGLMKQLYANLNKQIGRAHV